MYIGFELKKISQKSFIIFNDFLEIGKKGLSEQKKLIEETLEEFENSDGSLNGDKMQSNWFPQIDADIFLSHSHIDEDLVIALAGWLNLSFGLKVFIDSCIWGYSKRLQKIIDNKYSRDENGSLNYNKIIYSSSHVHMMLNTALMQMIDNCECVIFINTPNSVKPKEVVDKIISPWIYSEIGMTKLIKKKSLQEHRTKYINENEYFPKLEIDYNLDTGHLIELSDQDLVEWGKQYNQYYKNAPLDYLYKIKTYTI